MENTSRDDDVRVMTLRLENEGAGRFFVLSNGAQNCQMYFHDPEDIRVIYETACQLWAQGDIAVPGDAESRVSPLPPPFVDSVARAFAKSVEQE